jgi:hypothetical protein
MNGRELRERTDAALAGLEGDTAPVRAWCFELGRLVRGRDEELAALAAAQAATAAELATAKGRVAVLEDQAAAARERLGRQATQLAALEGELAALKAVPVVNREAMMKGFQELLPHDPTTGVPHNPAAMKALAAQARARAPKAVCDAVGVQALCGDMTEDLAYVLLNLGFSEYQLCLALSGVVHRFKFVVE